MPRWKGSLRIYWLAGMTIWRYNSIKVWHEPETGGVPPSNPPFFHSRSMLSFFVPPFSSYRHSDSPYSSVAPLLFFRGCIALKIERWGRAQRGGTMHRGRCALLNAIIARFPSLRVLARPRPPPPTAFSILLSAQPSSLLYSTTTGTSLFHGPCHWSVSITRWSLTHCGLNIFLIIMFRRCACFCVEYFSVSDHLSAAEGYFAVCIYR